MSAMIAGSSNGEDWVREMLSRLAAIEEKLDKVGLGEEEWYSVAAAAKVMKKSEFRVREMCRLGGLKAKRIGGNGNGGAGGQGEWRIHKDEIARWKAEGWRQPSTEIEQLRRDRRQRLNGFNRK